MRHGLVVESLSGVMKGFLGILHPRASPADPKVFCDVGVPRQRSAGGGILQGTRGLEELCRPGRHPADAAAPHGRA